MIPKSKPHSRHQFGDENVGVSPTEFSNHFKATIKVDYLTKEGQFEERFGIWLDKKGFRVLVSPSTDLRFEAVAAPDFFSLEDSTVEHFYLPVPDSHACSRGARPKILAHEDERRLESSWFHDNIKDKSHMIQLHKYTTGDI
ncbi:hypothetical protein F8388_010999 [Cannabis sativa]|uniref:Uncharacterized protein n=1 Tax=Cannabis sativa TaxID=3483 RepID=A0A7J6FQR1_CANSA|nr:hypothetical protein F8388_010999 [Cannabis sativa]